MGDKTKIEWCDSTWNPVTGCSPISEGCANCYASRMAARFPAAHGAPFSQIVLHPERLDQPLRWKKPRRIFVCSMGDLFHDGVEFEDVATVFGIMAGAPQHTFMILTKRPGRMREFFEWIADRGGAGCVANNYPAEDLPFAILAGLRSQAMKSVGCSVGIGVYGWPLPNVWLGVTAENQEQADKRTPILLQTPAAKRFVSIEPMIGQVLSHNFLTRVNWRFRETVDGRVFREAMSVSRGIDWIIVGGETGPRARLLNREWVSIVCSQCRAFGVPFFFKGWGGRLKNRKLDGRTWEDFPR